MAVGAAIALLLSVGVVYGMTGRVTPQQGAYSGGMMGGYGGGGSVGSWPTYSGGMMGGHGGMMGSHGGMMGTGSMMGGYGSMMGGWMQSMASYMNHMWNSSANGAFVAIFNGAFYPTALTVSKGTTVTWVNMDFAQHTVTSGSEQAPTNLFDSHGLNHMQGFSYTFNTAGTYDYFCDIHPSMVGTITVTG